MTPRSPFAAACGAAWLVGCTGAGGGGALPGTRFALEVLSTAPSAPIEGSLLAPTIAAERPAEPARPAVLAPSAPLPSGSPALPVALPIAFGGVVPAPPRPATAGVVQDALGRPVAGAGVTGGGQSAMVDASGQFRFASAVDGALEASAPGYNRQRLAAPGGFALLSLFPTAAAPIVLSGSVDPPLAGALVSYADASGSLGRTQTDGSGAFTLPVTLAQGAPAPGVLAVVANLPASSGSRQVLDLSVSALAGALAFDASGPASGLKVSLKAATGSFGVSPAPLGAGLVASRAVLMAQDAAGRRVSMGEIVGPWPGRLPTFELAPGLHFICALVADDAARAGYSVVEHRDPAPNETWRPSLMALPRLDAAGGAGWQANPGLGSAALFPLGDGRPMWESLVADGPVVVPVPSDGATYVIEASAWDVGPVPWPSLVKVRGAPMDARHATRRLTVKPSTTP